MEDENEMGRNSRQVDQIVKVLLERARHIRSKDDFNAAIKRYEAAIHQKRENIEKIITVMKNVESKAIRNDILSNIGLLNDDVIYYYDSKNKTDLASFIVQHKKALDKNYLLNSQVVQADTHLKEINKYKEEKSPNEQIEYLLQCAQSHAASWLPIIRDHYKQQVTKVIQADINEQIQAANDDKKLNSIENEYKELGLGERGKTILDIWNESIKKLFANKKQELQKKQREQEQADMPQAVEPEPSTREKNTQHKPTGTKPKGKPPHKVEEKPAPKESKNDIFIDRFTDFIKSLPGHASCGIIFPELCDLTQKITLEAKDDEYIINIPLNENHKIRNNDLSMIKQKNFKRIKNPILKKHIMQVNKLNRCSKVTRSLEEEAKDMVDLSFIHLCMLITTDLCMLITIEDFDAGIKRDLSRGKLKATLTFDLYNAMYSGLMGLDLSPINNTIPAQPPSATNGADKEKLKLEDCQQQIKKNLAQYITLSASTDEEVEKCSDQIKQVPCIKFDSCSILDRLIDLGNIQVINRANEFIVKFHWKEEYDGMITRGFYVNFAFENLKRHKMCNGVLNDCTSLVVMYPQAEAQIIMGIRLGLGDLLAFIYSNNDNNTTYKKEYERIYDLLFINHQNKSIELKLADFRAIIELNTNLIKANQELTQKEQQAKECHDKLVESISLLQKANDSNNLPTCIYELLDLHTGTLTEKEGKCVVVYNISEKNMKEIQENKVISDMSIFHKAGKIIKILREDYEEYQSLIRENKHVNFLQKIIGVLLDSFIEGATHCAINSNVYVLCFTDNTLEAHWEIHANIQTLKSKLDEFITQLKRRNPPSHKLEAVAAPFQEKVPIDISGIPKAELLAALYNAAKILQTTTGIVNSHILKQSSEKMSIKKASFAIKRQEGLGLAFDFLFERPLKVDISGDFMNTAEYNESNGQGKAEQVVEKLRKKHPHMPSSLVTGASNQEQQRRGASASM